MTAREVILEGGSPWGFRMHGGADVGQPLRISRVNPGSKAAQRGVREGDIITTINGQPTRGLANTDAHSLLRGAGQALHLGLNQDASPKRRSHKQQQQQPSCTTTHQNTPEVDTGTPQPCSSATTTIVVSSSGSSSVAGASPSVSKSTAASPASSQSTNQQSKSDTSSPQRTPPNSATNTAAQEPTKSHHKSSSGGGRQKRSRRLKARKKALKESICESHDITISEPEWEELTEITPLPDAVHASPLLSAEALCLSDDVEPRPDIPTVEELKQLLALHLRIDETPKRKSKFKRRDETFPPSLRRLEVIAEEDDIIYEDINSISQTNNNNNIINKDEEEEIENIYEDVELQNCNTGAVFRAEQCYIYSDSDEEEGEKHEQGEYELLPCRVVQVISDEELSDHSIDNQLQDTTIEIIEINDEKDCDTKEEIINVGSPVIVNISQIENKSVNISDVNSEIQNNKENIMDIIIENSNIDTPIDINLSEDVPEFIDTNSMCFTDDSNSVHIELNDNNLIQTLTAMNSSQYEENYETLIEESSLGIQSESFYDEPIESLSENYEHYLEETLEKPYLNQEIETENFEDNIDSYCSQDGNVTTEDNILSNQSQENEFICSNVNNIVNKFENNDVKITNIYENKKYVISNENNKEEEENDERTCPNETYEPQNDIKHSNVNSEVTEIILLDTLPPSTSPQLVTSECLNIEKNKSEVFQNNDLIIYSSIVTSQTHSSNNSLVLTNEVKYQPSEENKIQDNSTQAAADDVNDESEVQLNLEFEELYNTNYPQEIVTETCISPHEEQTQVLKNEILTDESIMNQEICIIEEEKILQQNNENDKIDSISDSFNSEQEHIDNNISSDSLLMENNYSTVETKILPTQEVAEITIISEENLMSEENNSSSNRTSSTSEVGLKLINNTTINDKPIKNEETITSTECLLEPEVNESKIINDEDLMREENNLVLDLTSSVTLDKIETAELEVTGETTPIQEDNIAIMIDPLQSMSFVTSKLAHILEVTSKAASILNQKLPDIITGDNNSILKLPVLTHCSNDNIGETKNMQENEIEEKEIEVQEIEEQEEEREFSLSEKTDSTYQLRQFLKSIREDMINNIDLTPTHSRSESLDSNCSLNTTVYCDIKSNNSSSSLSAYFNNSYMSGTQPKSLRKLCLDLVAQFPNGLKLMLDWGLATVEELDLRIQPKLNLEFTPPASTSSCSTTHRSSSSSLPATSHAEGCIKRGHHGGRDCSCWLSVPAYGPYFVCLSPAQQKILPQNVSPEKAAALLDLHYKVSQRRAYHEPGAHNKLVTTNMGLNEEQQEQRLKATVLSDWLALARSEQQQPTLRAKSPLTRFEKLNEDNVTSVMKTARKFEAERYHISKQRDIAVEIQEQKQFTAHREQNEHYTYENTVEEEEEAISKPCNPPVTENEILREQMFSEYQQQMAERAERRQNKILRVSEMGSSGQSRVVVVPGAPESAQLEVLEEFASRARKRMEKLGISEEEIMTTLATSQDTTTTSSDTTYHEQETRDVFVLEGGATQLPKRIQEDSQLLLSSADKDDSCTRLGDKIGAKNMEQPEDGEACDLLKEIQEELGRRGQAHRNSSIPVLAPTFKATAPKPGVWSPKPGRAASASAASAPSPAPASAPSTSIQNGSDEPPPPPVWTPKASPTLERKEFRPVKFEATTPPLKTPPEQDIQVSAPFDINSIEPEPPLRGKASTTISSSLDRKLTLNIPRLPRAQNPTVTLLQKAREGQLPRGALYLDHKMSAKDSEASGSKSSIRPDDILYSVRKEAVSEDKKTVELSPKKYDGIGPTTREGIPIVLRSGIKEENYGKWYKRMYDSLHKAGRDDDHITIRYRPNRRGYPYSAAGGYASEPEPAGGYDSDIGYSAKYATLDRRRIKNKDSDFTTSTMPRSRYMSPSVKYACEVYKNQPGRIEDYEPGHSSISDKEAKLWWDEVMDIFDGDLAELEMLTKHSEGQSSSGKPFMTYALKESGYESDSQLVFKRRDQEVSSGLSPTEHKQAYKSIQSGGEVPLHGLRKPAPERPKDDTEIEYFPISPTLTRIRVHKPRHQVPSFLYYPVRAHTTPPIFSSYKRTAKSAIPKAPIPPQRRSSRHNSTLRLWSRITPPPPGEQVRFLRERLSCRLGARSPSGRSSKVPIGTTTRSSTVILPRASREDRALRLSVSVSPRGRELLNSPTPRRSTESLLSPTRRETRTASPSPVRISASAVRHAECRKEDTKKVAKSSAPAPSSLARPKSVIQEEERRAKEARKKVKERVAKATGTTTTRKTRDETKKNGKKVTEPSPSTEKRKRSVKEKKPVEKAIQKTESRREPEVTRRDQFFQHLFLRDQPQAVASLARSSSVVERARRFTHPRRSLSRPSMDPSLKIFLTQRRAVSESPFRVLDVVLHRSLSQLPSLATLPPQNIKERSSSEPPLQRALRDPGNLRPMRMSSPSPSRLSSPLPRMSSPPSRVTSPISSSPSARRVRAKRSISPVRARSQSPLSSRNPEYLEYVLELKHSMPKSARFKELARLYGSLERIGQLQRTTASCSDLRRAAGREPREANFDRWWRERTREKAEKELCALYGELRAAQKEHVFGFKPPTGPTWRPDSGLRCRELSVEDLRAKFQDIVERKGETELQISKIRDLEAKKDNYKPLWRGSSVLNLAEGWDGCNEEARPPRSRSAGSVNRRWSSLSLQQVNALKDQLTDIYGSMKNVQAARAAVEYEVSVPVIPRPPPKEPLQVRRNSLLTRDQLYSPVVKRKEAKRSASLKADSVSALPTCSSPVGLSESEKKRLSMSLSQEILDRVKNTKKTTTPPAKRIYVPKATTQQAKKSLPETTTKSSPKQETEKKSADIKVKKSDKNEKSTPKITKKSSESSIASETRKETLAKRLPPAASPTHSELSPRTCYSLDASDASSMTSQTGKSDFLLVLAPSDTHQSRKDMRRAVEEWAAGKAIKNEISQRAASETESASSETSNKTVIYREPSRFLSTSQSCTNLKELFGERSRPPIPIIKRSSNSPLRTRSASPDARLRACASGDVRKLTEKFERCRSDPDLTIQTHISKRRVVSRTPSPTIPAKPRRLKPEDRFISRVNVISKMAALQRRSAALRGDKGLERLLQRERLARELARRRRCLSGDVDRIRKQFEERDSVSLLGQMFTSTPDIRELNTVAPIYFRHQSPSPSINSKRTRSSPDLQDLPAKTPTPILKSGVFENQPFNPEIHRPKFTYRPPAPQTHLQERSRAAARNVTFQDPLVLPSYYQDFDSGKESPHKFVECGEVTIHYRSPVRGLARDAALSEEELARRQEEAMRRIYQEERRRKYLQELHDMESRRHTDNFTPSQKSPIPLNRYDDFFDEVPSSRGRDRTPEPKMVARALYNFVGQSPRELTFRRGDIIIVRRQIDKNWYEGEHNASIGLFPFNYVEIIPYDGVRSFPKGPLEGKARAKFNFVAQTHLELSLVKGENVVLTRRVDDNWYEGRIGVRKGIFPVSYVEVIQEPGERLAPISPKPVASPASHSLLLNGSVTTHQSGPSSRPHQYNPYSPPSHYNLTGRSILAAPGTKQLAPVNQTLHIDTHSEPVPYRALYNYKPQNDDELELREGDTVFVMEKCDDGWYVGSSHRSGHFGTFPGNYVERV